jgi:hypothetical protein
MVETEADGGLNRQHMYREWGIGKGRETWEPGRKIT